MSDWSAASVAIILFALSAFFSLLLAWFSQNQRLTRVEGRMEEAERAERECLERERKLSVRISDLERLVGSRSSHAREVRRKST